MTPFQKVLPFSRTKNTLCFTIAVTPLGGGVTAASFLQNIFLQVYCRKAGYSCIFTDLYYGRVKDKTLHGCSVKLWQAIIHNA